MLSLKRRKSTFKFCEFTSKQKKLLTWWMPNSPHCKKDAIICDGAVRGGKTVIMALSFVIWSMETFSGKNFGFAGKTIGSLRRNVVEPLKQMLTSRGYDYKDRLSENILIIEKDGVVNMFYLFGGKHEKSQDLVQGFTAAGFLFDEVALMPETFVSQCIARCSIDGAKLWYNCNPEGPFHWFKVQWIDKLKEKNAIRLHFTLDDNPSLSKELKERYMRMFSGVFFERFILGLWVMAEGIIYSMFDRNMVVNAVPAGVKINKKWIGVDYGQSNATVFLLCGLGSDGILYLLDEYYHEGRTENVQKSPSDYSKDFKKWKIKNGVNGMEVRKDATYIDPSAKGFMLQLHQDGEKQIRQADNSVLKGIELFSSIIASNRFRVLKHCKKFIGELSAYRWDPKKQLVGEDVPIKQFDHGLDAIRYVINGTRMIWQTLVITAIPEQPKEKINRA